MHIRQFPSLAQFRQLSETANVIPVCAEILADMETPVSLLKKFYHRQGSLFLLESVEGGEKWAFGLVCCVFCCEYDWDFADNLFGVVSRC